MARGSAVWGIDIGQCALKALRCSPHSEPNRVTVDAFDYVEYPKILSQPEADPVELVGNAFKEFLSRNSVRGDRVAISVSGQAGLARFIKLPPVESKKIPDIVKYEAKQQIPFALEDVVWDYQQMAGGSEEDGFALETEVGLFAMKREQVIRALKPYNAAGIEVDLIQLAPLALYNFATFDQMPNLPPADEFDTENPPESIVLISLGTDTTDLVITNGYRVWQRSIPLGGNHFTKALTKELKLTFAAAEHLKRNAATAENPKLLFQAMRPVFNDMLTELQRSIGYFQNINRTAKIGRAIALGNAMKLPGLQRYLQQNLGLDVVRLEAFRGLSGSAVVDAPAFKENLLALAVPYGLAVQALNQGRIHTNLIPRELLKDRMIRAKKPWAVAAAALLMLGTSLSFAKHWQATASVDPNRFKDAKLAADGVKGTANTYTSEFDTSKADYQRIERVAINLNKNAENQRLWLDVLRGINVCIPQPTVDPKKTKPGEERPGIYIEQIESQYIDDVKTWYDGVVAQKWPGAPEGPATADAAATATTPDATAIPPADASALPTDVAAPPAEPVGNVAAPPDAVPSDATATDPAQTDPAQTDATQADATAAATPPAPPEPLSGPGFIIQLSGYHYHNDQKDTTNQGRAYVLSTLIENLKKQEIVVPLPDGTSETVAVASLGFRCPVMVPHGPIDWKYQEPDLDSLPKQPGNTLMPTPLPVPTVERGASFVGVEGVKMIELPRFEFVVQFIWQQPKAAERAAALANAEPAPSPPSAASPTTDAGADSSAAPPAAADNSTVAPAVETSTKAPDSAAAPSAAAAVPPAAASTSPSPDGTVEPAPTPVPPSAPTAATADAAVPSAPSP